MHIVLQMSVCLSERWYAGISFYFKPIARERLGLQASKFTGGSCHDKYMIPIDFEVAGSKVTVTLNEKNVSD